MGRKKQVRPHRSGTILEKTTEELKDQNPSVTENNESADLDKPYFVEIDKTSWVSDSHLDISEIVLTNLKVSTEFYGYSLSEEIYQNPEYSLRFRLDNANEFLSRIKLGHWPVLAASNITLELVKVLSVEDKEEHVILTGNFDAPDEGISGLVHLASMKFFTLRLSLGPTLSDNLSSVRVRVEMLKSIFDACVSLLDNARPIWKKSMMNIMAWLRPEVVTSESRYGYSGAADAATGSHMDFSEDLSVSRKRTKFDVVGFYEAVKPSKCTPMLEDDLPDLLPELRPYQRRAAYWMVEQEKPDSLYTSRSEKIHSNIYPLCTPVTFIDTSYRMFYNSFSGSVSLHPEPSPPYIVGGILADEMGLGKTVELLACIFAHRMSASELSSISQDITDDNGAHKINITRTKRERVECTCGAVTDNLKYNGLWVQCDVCDAWQHADCVGYSAEGKSMKLSEENEELGFQSKKNKDDIVEIDGTHICPLCLELIQAVDSPVPTGATLIVCPAPILPQWHSEINRHTRPGSLKTCIYEGVRNNPSTTVVDISELLRADIVLTTYDVLKEDLFHDSDRHEGDRRLMRFHKRYPVIPTVLTRIFWWRICLDEAQMAENSAAAATEMALRLHSKYRWCITGTPIQRKLDDLHGLLRFLQAYPFDVLRWWADVIRDPYERGDTGAMAFTHEFLKKIMWRSSKKHVAEDLRIPPQDETLSWLSLSPIEAHFYQRQHETCLTYAREVVDSFKIGSNSSNAQSPSDHFLTHTEAAKLLNSLLKLRQACCHPQVGSSGLRSLQQSPMTMEEILSVLVGKTKVEGEDALRKLIVALNGLAAISVIKQDFRQAVSLYKEALASAEEHSGDFRIDPLLNIHIHHNLGEILPLISNSEHQVLSNSPEKRPACDIEECDRRSPKRTKLSEEESVDSSNHDECLKLVCEKLKQKFLSVFNTKLAVTQQDFTKLYQQVSKGIKDRKNQQSAWWLEALERIEENQDTATELLRKISDAVSGTQNTKSNVRIASCYRSITTLKYYIESGLDSLEDSRETLLNRLLEIDKSLENPSEEDIEKVRYCPNCQATGDGALCVHCELDELFQVYEARLFRLNKGNDGGVITSVEEAIDLQKKKTALNRFYWNLSQNDKNAASSRSQYEDDIGKRRGAGEKVTVSKSPSELEVILGIIRGSSKALLDRESMSEAIQQLGLLEGMRKEYAQSRSMAIAQAMVLRAHDELKMATSRLRLREDENDNSIDALAEEELDIASVENSSEKFLASSSLLRIKGQLRYLKGLVQSKQNVQTESTSESTLDQETMKNSKATPEEKENRGGAVKTDEESCPVCQDKLTSQKMVFQCGHVTCCKCLFAMSERRGVKFNCKWVMCPTCRQHTDFGNIAFVDDTQNKSSNNNDTSQDSKKTEASIIVQGSYGTKIEAVTRRILWINTEKPKSKVLVFSSWNDVLDVLEHAFAANNISFIRMKGGRKAHVAISQFKGEKNNSKGSKKDIQVLLLLIQHGANGLNLLEAEHVILVEPLLNPAAEAQAISRVHRIGQTNKTLVHRFIVKDTVEESLYKLNKSRNTGSFLSGNKKNQDQPVFTLKDVQSLFKVAENIEQQPAVPNLMHLPPSVAAAQAAERRLKQQIT